MFASEQRPEEHHDFKTLESLSLEDGWKLKLTNMKRAWEEFSEKKLVLESRPFKAILELTQNCNFKCPMCPQATEEKFQKYNPEFNIKPEVFEKISNELFPTATLIDLRGFGETTILPFWPDVVDHLENFPFIEWHLVTNLSLNNDKTWNKMMKLGFNLAISFDAATKETFETIRVNSNFRKILHNLYIVSEGRKDHDFGFVYFVSTIQKKNVHEMRKMVELASIYGVPEVQFKAVQSFDPHVSLEGYSPDKMKKYAESAIDAGIDLGVHVTFNDPLFSKNLNQEKIDRVASFNPVHSAERKFTLPPSPDFAPSFWEENGIPQVMVDVINSVKVAENQKCFKPFHYTYINYEGKMGTCNHMMFPDMKVMGDLATNPLEEVWNSKNYQNFRKELLFANPTDPRCQWCFKNRQWD
jgi:radical SAM protein with 4Fe4S-binding SPASM domain